MKTFEAILHSITWFNDKIGRYFSCWIIYILIAVLVYDVAMRYFFIQPTIWGYDMVWILYGVFVFLGGAYAFIYDAHVKVDLLYNRFPVRVRALFDVLCFLILFFPAFYILTIYTFIFAQTAYSFGERSPYALWKPKVWPLKAILFFSMLTMFLQGIVKFTEQLKILLKGEKA